MFEIQSKNPDMNAFKNIQFERDSALEALQEFAAKYEPYKKMYEKISMGIFF